GDLKSPPDSQKSSQLPESFKLSGSSKSTEENRPRRSGLEIVPVTGGTFTMGSPESEKGRHEDECQHQVTVQSFSIGKYEVTQADWREIMGEDPPELGFKGCGECPVESVSWNDVQDFLKALNKIHPGKNYRLPTEAEWEYAARGGNKSEGYQYSGSKYLKKVAWYDGNSGSKTHRVGELAANELGIFDMSGNVWEWCQDKYGPYPGCSFPSSITFGRVLRGGSWGNDHNGSSVGRRDVNYPDLRSRYGGFRCAQGY
ncbi:MAG: formylglycine-generating enzyme family protein, partial [Saprospiraceae bacterium]